MTRTTSGRASTPISSSSSSSVRNSPERLLIGDLLAVAHEAHPGHHEHLDGVLVEAHGLGRVADACHGPVVVGAPDVDELVEAAAELLADVADVRGEVGRLAARAEDDAVLVVAERGRAEPGGAVLLVDVAACAERVHGTLDPALVVEAGLALPDIEVDAEPLQAGLDAVADAGAGPGAHAPRRGRRRARWLPPRRRPACSRRARRRSCPDRPPPAAAHPAVGRPRMRRGCGPGGPSR